MTILAKAQYNGSHIYKSKAPPIEDGNIPKLEHGGVKRKDEIKRYGRVSVLLV